jgi:hypothetical protein
VTATLARAVGLNTPHGTGPWNRTQFAGLVGGNVLAVALAFVGWVRASSEGRAGDQIVWLNVSFAGVVVALGVNGFFLARGRQTVRLATPVALAGTRRSGAAPVPSSNGSGPIRSAGAPRPGRFVAVAGLNRYHRHHCALVSGKAVEEAMADSFAAAGRIPCEVCEP